MMFKELKNKTEYVSELLITYFDSQYLEIGHCCAVLRRNGDLRSNQESPAALLVHLAFWPLSPGVGYMASSLLGLQECQKASYLKCLPFHQLPESVS